MEESFQLLFYLVTRASKSNILILVVQTSIFLISQRIEKENLKKNVKFVEQLKKK